ncbi:hypothetical protein CHS0354_024406 [Potamilus streckersoni]|uniref:Uncharacterized protein n=1 Tax=Potamilus streckersoni TaxID=2493646 RepID=A0AAE0SWT1_9BIVA|nr:hypothetical protein CHS0354_024406 [Potamilus streckersoni]
MNLDKFQTLLTINNVAVEEAMNGIILAEYLASIVTRRRILSQGSCKPITPITGTCPADAFQKLYQSSKEMDSTGFKGKWKTENELVKHRDDRLCEISISYGTNRRLQKT